jgi:hypothetical protein
MASTTNSGDQFSATDWSEPSMLSELMQQKWLLIGLGCVIGAFWLRSRRSAPEEAAARRLVRDWRRVDGPEDVRDLLGANVPTILRPALLAALEEIEDLVHHWFRRLEREIQHL